MIPITQGSVERVRSRLVRGTDGDCRGERGSLAPSARIIHDLVAGGCLLAEDYAERAEVGVEACVLDREDVGRLARFIVVGVPQARRRLSLIEWARS